jgi:hypothetical protein
MTAVLLLAQFIPQLAYTPAARAEPQQEEKLHYYITPNNFLSFGSWSLSGSHVVGRSTSILPDEPYDEGEPATVKVNVQTAGQYKVWVRDRDYATNQPGTRTFQVEVDGARVNKTFGAHGQEGFRWTEAGVYNFNAGFHELALIDTSAFFARCEGFFITKDLTLVPPQNLEDLLELAQPEDPFSFLPTADFPEWAVADVPSTETASIENESVKVVFHKGTGQEGSLVQNEIFIKENGQWLQVKQKTEQLGFLMMAAANSEYIGQAGQAVQFRQQVNVDGTPISSITSDFFRSGVPVWFIPSGFTKINDHKLELSFPSHSEADLKVIFEFDGLSNDPKVTLEADFPQSGAYSFLLFNGDETAYEDFDNVTAPLLYVKKKVPETSTVFPEAYLFTPMATLHYAEGNTRFGGKMMTSGIAMDPVSVPQDVAYPETSSFGLVLRGPEREVRPQFTAPMFGSEHSLFEAGDSYSVSYRIINQATPWYDAFKHTAENLYNARDIRTNYFHSLNEAIYNATDLMMDDDYGGWDVQDMAHYNMEEKDLVSISNSMAALQRYLLTEDEQILDDRAIPSLAFLLGRGKYHYRGTGSGTSSYAGALPNAIGGTVSNYSTHVYGGLYEMTQGRMPFLLDHAIQSPSKQVNLTGVADQGYMYKATGNEEYLNNLKAQADAYLLSNPNTKMDTQLTSSFVYGDYIPAVTTLLAAYEATGDQRYLDGAEKNAQLLLTGVWTTGYHDDNATTDYTVTQEKTGTRPVYANRFNFWWHGEEQWRLGNVDGEAKSAQELGVPLATETAPGWLGGRVGMGTEHLVTPGHGNVITMNNWAGMLTKLSVYTGDEFFYNMARNATIGRYGSYPGYYQDRIIFHQMKENYPYTGPDFTSVYWHHIPVFISMLEDFLINSAWVKSEQHIKFPSLYQSGYAYFSSNQFGHAPGNFYEEEDMWLWLDRGIVEPDTVEIDYVAARKDGVLGVALMNEGNQAATSTVTLGEKADPTGSYTGAATVYEADGSKSTVNVVNGAFTLTIPAKGIKSVVLHGLTAVKTPAYANPDLEYSNYTEGTAVEHTRGEGHVIQVTPESYHAYVYTTDMDDTVSKVVMNYTIGEQSYTREKAGYPYEFLIKVDDPSKSFSYQLVAHKTGGGTEALGGGELKPYDFSHPGIGGEEPAQEAKRTVQLDTGVKEAGVNASNQTLKFVVPAEDLFPLLPKADLLKGMKLNGVLTHKTNGSVLQLSSHIVGNEFDPATETLSLMVKPTVSIPLAVYSDYNISLSIFVPEELVTSYGDVNIAVTQAGMNTSRKEIRLVVQQSDFPFGLVENKLQGLKIKGTLTHKQNQSVLQLDSVIRGNEIRDNGTTVLVVEPTAAVPLKDYKDYNFALQVSAPAYWLKTKYFNIVNTAITQAGMHAGRNEIRLVTAQSQFPQPLGVNSLQGMSIKGTLTHKQDQSVLQLDSVIRSNEIRDNGTTVLVVEPTAAVPLNDYKDYNFAVGVYIPAESSGHPYGVPFNLTVNQAGMNPSQRMLRLVVPQSAFPLPLEGILPNGLRITGEFKHKTDGTVLPLDSFVSSTEIRTNGTAVLVVPPTSQVLLKEYKSSDYSISVTIHPEWEGVPN